MTPLGLPVVPLVYMMIQMSSESTSVAGSSGLAAAIASSSGMYPSYFGLSTAKEMYFSTVAGSFSSR